MVLRAIKGIVHAILHLALVLATTCLLLVLALGLGWLAYQARYADRIYQGVTLQGLPLGGLTPSEARELAAAEYEAGNLPIVSLRTAQQAWTVSLADMGATWDLNSAVQEAWMLGRGGVFVQDMLMRWRLLWQGYRIVPALSLSDGATMQELRRVAKQTERAALGTQFWISGLEAHSQDARSGREIAIEATQQAILRQVRAALGASAWEETLAVERLRRGAVEHRGAPLSEPVTVALVFREVSAPLSEVAGAPEQVNLVLSAPLTLVFATQEFAPNGDVEPVARRWAIDQATLASWLTMEPDSAGTGEMRVALDAGALRAFLNGLSDEISRPPREGRFGYDPATRALAVRAPGQNGYALDIDAAQAAISRAAQSTERKVVLPVRIIAPRVTRADLEAIMPLELIGEGTSAFAGSPSARLQNIKVATSRFDGIAAPGQADFSFLQYLGPVTVANGYSEANIISGERTVLGPGGGVCQVSTTAYRAAFWAGFAIVERAPHSYRIAWYEPPLGLDASVWSPSVDLRFHNDLDTPFLVHTQVDAARSTVTFRFYGKSDGRKVSLRGPEISNETPAGEPVYDIDPTLRPGARIQTERAHDGLDVTLYRTIERGGNSVEEPFFSRYAPWPARYSVGPSAEQAQSSQQTGG